MQLYVDSDNTCMLNISNFIESPIDSCSKLAQVIRVSDK